MTRLHTLRNQLHALRRYRQAARWTLVLSAAAIIALATLGAVYLLDVLFELPVGQRVVLLVLASGVVVWAVMRYCVPLLNVKETEEELALKVEAHHQIDSDLIAALEFEKPQARQWGSPQLEEAVVDCVARLGGGLNVFAGFSLKPVWRRLGILAVVLLIFVLVVALAPRHFAVFFQRLLLARTHYPTATKIVELTINGKPVSLKPGATETIFVGYGGSVSFRAKVAGEVPGEGQIELRTEPTARREPVPLTPVADGSDEFTGEVPRLIGAIEYSVRLGDAWTDPARIDVIALPTIQPMLQLLPPAYAASVIAPEASNSLQHSVLTGSTIQVSLAATKPLERAVLKVYDLRDEGPESVYPLQFVSENEGGEVWSLKKAGTPFADVRKPFCYRIEVEDTDGLKPTSELNGRIGIRVDRKPQVSGSLISKVVLPTAAPTVELRAVDDFGISSLTLNVQIFRKEQEAYAAALWEKERERFASSGAASDGGVSTAAETATVEIVELAPLRSETFATGVSPKPRPLRLPAMKPRLPLTGAFALDLKPFLLEKGDTLRLTIHARDERGEAPGETGASEPFVLTVSDAAGVLAAIQKPDEDAEKRLTDIQRIQLGIGDSP